MRLSRLFFPPSCFRWRFFFWTTWRRFSRWNCIPTPGSGCGIGSDNSLFDFRFSVSAGQDFQSCQIRERLFPAAPAHLRIGRKGNAKRRPLRPPEQTTAEFRIQIHTGNPGRFSIRHSWNRRGDRRRHTACSAAGTTDRSILFHSNNELLFGIRSWNGMAPPTGFEPVLPG